MRIANALAIVVVVLLASAPARAEVTKLGGFSLGQKVRKPAIARMSLYGCAGGLRPFVDTHKKVVQVRFSTRGCSVETVAAAITKHQKHAPIVNARGDRLWEGKTASIILSASMSSQTTPIILLVPPGAGAKRICWPGDGFDAFWSRFKAAVASGKPDAVAGSFLFPAKDYEGTVLFATARELANKWGDVIDHEDAKRIAAGELTPTCRVDGDRYKLILESSYYELDATLVKGAWKWSAVHALTTN
jgi:hypothetical protein